MSIVNKKILYAIFALIILLIIAFAWSFFSIRPAYTISQAAVPSITNLVSYWNFDEGSGTKAYDYMKLNNATLYNNPVWVNGKIGKALKFNGSNYVEAPFSSSLNLSKQITITAWINPSSITSYSRVVTKSHTSDALPYTLYGLLFDNANHIRLEIAKGGTQNAVNGKTTIPLSTWTFVVGTYDGSTMKIYVNGVLDTSSSLKGSIDTNNMPLSIGRSGFGSDYFTGMIDEVQIWNRALTAGEVLNEYNSVVHLVSYWKFDNNALDSLGNNNHGTVYGATYTTGKAGNALNFDGIDDYVNISDSNSLDITNFITIEAWINPFSWSSTFPRIVSKEASTSAAPYALELNSSGKSVDLCLDTGGGEKCVDSGANSISLKQWYHVAGTWNGTHSQIYVNGNLKKTLAQSGSMAATSNDILIGNNPSKNRQYNGTIDEIKIWNIALTAGGVLNEYNSTVQICSDGTPYDSCNVSNKPKYCSGGTLINKCSQCGCPSSQSCNATTNACYIPTTAQFQVTVDSSKVIGTNNLSLGFHLDWERPNYFIDPSRQVYRNLAKDSNFKLVRVFDYRSTSSYGYANIMPCTSWSSATKKCASWNWTTVDSLTDAIFSVGAEPLFVLGAAWAPISSRIPAGMPINSSTGLPNPDEYANYAKEWVNHFKLTGKPVRYYELLNEPYHWYDSPSPNAQKLKDVVNWWNAAARAMRAVNSQIYISNDALTQKEMLDYWVNYGDNVDSLNFHKYDSGNPGQNYNDAQMFSRAESFMFDDSSSWYGVDTARQIWYNKRGKWLPVMATEFNFNFTPYPSVQNMTGAVWTSLVIRKAILKGLNYVTYFEFSDGPNAGAELGMINYSNNKPWYPYYVQKIIGTNLTVGDSIVNSSSNYNNVSSIAWIDNGKLNILLIHKSPETKTISLSGVSGAFTYQKIDNTYPYNNAQIQKGTINAGDTITLKGYTVMLLQ